MDKRTKIRILTIIGALVLFGVLYWYIQTFMNEREITGEESVTYVKATVLELIEDNTQKDANSEGMLRGSQQIILEITSGEHEGETYETTNYMSLMYNVDCQEGAKIVARLDKRSDGSFEASVFNYDRQGALVGGIVVFMALLCIIGGKKGIMSLVALLYTLLSVFFLLIPAIYFGAPVIPATVGIIILTNVVCFIMIDGLNKKTLSAVLGTTAGVLVAGIVAFAMGHITHITGLQTEEAENLLLVGSDYGLKITHLFTAGILIAAMGAVMDVAMSIASSVNELHVLNPNLSVGDLFKSGMNIGRDTMGTMSNTLILAFVGSSFNLILMLYSYNVPFTQLWATDLVAREVIQGMAGSIGIIMTVPFVAFFGAVAMKNKKQESPVAVPASNTGNRKPGNGQAKAKNSNKKRK